MIYLTYKAQSNIEGNKIFDNNQTLYSRSGKTTLAVREISVYRQHGGPNCFGSRVETLRIEIGFLNCNCTLPIDSD